MSAVVGDADGADLARLLGFEEGEPGAATGFFAAVGGMNQIPISPESEKKRSLFLSINQMNNVIGITILI